MADKINLLSIAEKTGYSVSTVSRVLSGKAEKYRISPRAAALIKEEAQRSNYSPNLVAQSLRTRKSQTIGLVVPGIDNPFFATLSSIIINLLADRGYHTLLADSREDEAEEGAVLDMFRRRNVDGIISVPVASSPALHEEISRSIPLVLIDRYFKSTVLPYVCTDNFAGASMATRFLLERGYRRILAVQGVPASMPNQERVRGFKAALKGYAVKSRIVGDATFPEEMSLVADMPLGVVPSGLIFIEEEQLGAYLADFFLQAHPAQEVFGPFLRRKGAVTVPLPVFSTAAREKQKQKGQGCDDSFGLFHRMWFSLFRLMRKYKDFSLNPGIVQYTCPTIPASSSATVVLRGPGGRATSGGHPQKQALNVDESGLRVPSTKIGLQRGWLGSAEGFHPQKQALNVDESGSRGGGKNRIWFPLRCLCGKGEVAQAARIVGAGGGQTHENVRNKRRLMPLGEAGAEVHGVSGIVLRTFRFAPSPPLRFACGYPLTAAGGQGPQANTAYAI